MGDGTLVSFTKRFNAALASRNKNTVNAPRHTSFTFSCPSCFKILRRALLAPEQYCDDLSQRRSQKISINLLNFLINFL